MNFGIRLIRSITVAYLILCVLLYGGQRTLLYFPSQEVNLPGVESVMLNSGGESLKVWTINRNASDAVIYFGGNGENVANSIGPLSQSLPGQAIYLVNYRGYGGSSGKPTEQGLFHDAESLYDALKDQHKHISVIGRSLGTGVAVYLGSVRSVYKMVLVTPYDSIEAIAKARYVVFPVKLLLKDKYDSLSRISDIDSPILALLAESDNVIPREHSERLLAAVNEEQLTKIVIKERGHNNLHTNPLYYRSLSLFLQNAQTANRVDEKTAGR